MAADLQERAREISAVAAGLAPAERDTFLERSCAGDAELRRAVESILEEDSRPTELLDVALPTGEARAAVGGDAEPALEAGRSLGKYRIVEKLGEGGMGEVFVAEDGELGRHVALKVLSGELALESQHLERFRREARALAALNHPNIVTIYSVERADGCHFLTMERVAGETLDRVVPEGGLELNELFRLAVPLAEAVAAAHAQGVTHRDLKPANVMLSDTGEVKVLDFGLAKLRQEQAGLGLGLPVVTLTQTGMLMGTIPYMSPEQVEGKPVDHRTDIFSLGIVLYEMATGRRPFQGDTSPGTMSAILKDSPAPVTRVRSRLPSRLAQIIDRCLQKDPEKRYQDAATLAQELASLRAAIEHHPTLFTSLRTLSTLMPRSRWARLATASSVVAILALIAVALSFDALRQRFLAAPADPEISSLAVLPLDNLSGEEGQDLADGMTEMLTTELSRIGGLRVISRGSVSRFKESDRPPSEIAQELGVDAVVEGGVVREGEQLRVTARLVHGESGFQLWADSFERSLQDVLILQGEVAQAIARQVRVTLTPQAEARLAGLGAVSPKAAELYLTGLSANIWWQGDVFEEAIAEEPEFAQAHAGLAANRAQQGLIGWPFPPEEAYGRARKSAARALEIDPDLAQGHAVLGQVAFYFDWDWGAAEQAFRRALELDPGSADSHGYLSQFLAAMGRFEEALAEAERFRELDPLSVWPNVMFCRVLYFDRQFDRALDQLHQRWEATNPSVHRMRWQLLNATGDLEGAASARWLYEAASGSPEPVVALYEEGLNTGGATGFWRAFIKEHMRTPKELFWAVDVARAHVQIGEHDQALAALELGFDRRRPNMVFLGVDPIWDPLRSDPRFNDLLVRLKLPQAQEPGASQAAGAS